jgi:hypothetical protein
MLVMERPTSTTEKQFGGTAALQALLSADCGFTSRDALEDDELSICSYVGADPVNFVDPLGLKKDKPKPPPPLPGEIPGATVTGDRCRAIDGCRVLVGEPPSLPNPIPLPPIDRGDDTGEEIVVTANRCAAALSEPGPVQATGLSAGGVLGIGMVGAVGVVQNPATGTRANFRTFGFGAGVGAGLGVDIPASYPSMASFVGVSDSWSFAISLPFPKMGAWGNTLSLGPNGFNFGVSGPLVRLEMVGTQTETEIFNCRLGRN